MTTSKLMVSAGKDTDGLVLSDIRNMAAVYKTKPELTVGSPFLDLFLRETKIMLTQKHRPHKHLWQLYS